ncbi:MAG: PilZ domain-containing protein [Alphaproteobacteria bacterium]|nr:PilZ domain-containing protein [Alphaproteobacteria bacterium]
MLANDLHDETIISFSQRAPLPPSAAERRQAPRHLTILRVGALIGREGRELCLIRNISAGGLMAHVYSHHAPGAAVAIELKTNHQISGTVIWAEGSNIGVQFEAPIDVGEMLSSQAVLENGWRPRLPRIEVDRLATLRCGARIYGVNTRDISQGGVKVETDEPLEVGREIVLTLDRFRPVHGVVRWCGDGLAGIAFNQLIPFGELMAWLRGETMA